MKIAFVASAVKEAQQAVQRLKQNYGDVTPDEADAIVVLGGDGLMLQTLHSNGIRNQPIYGMNFGSVGFLMNEYSEEDLIDRLQKAETNVIHPLRSLVRAADGSERLCMAINEVALFRQSYQAAKLRVSVDGKVRLQEMICDGILLATPAGSTAYNLSVHGPIIPLNSPLLALTPISPFRPRRWRGAILKNEAKVVIEVLEAEKRPVSVGTEMEEIKSALKVEIAEDQNISIRLMFDPGHALDERILSEQFSY
ncbi:MAG: NAD kinase [Methyloligellaceae bacterium]